MERDELAKRYQQAQFKAMATAAEQQPAEDPEQGAQQNRATLSTLAQIMGVKIHKAADNYMSEEDRLRRWAGLK